MMILQLIFCCYPWRLPLQAKNTSLKRFQVLTFVMSPTTASTKVSCHTTLVDARRRGGGGHCMHSRCKHGDNIKRNYNTILILKKKFLEYNFGMHTLETVTTQFLNMVSPRYPHELRSSSQHLRDLYS